MLRKISLWKYLLINITKGTEVTSLIYFITFVGMLLGFVLFLVLRSEIMSGIYSSVVDVMRNVSLFGFSG